MPLSEHEQRILDEIEKNLYQEDPRFARDVGRREPRFSVGNRVRLGKIMFILGFAFLIGFFVSRWLFVGVLSFGCMVGGIVLVAGSIRGVTVAGRGGRDRLAQLVERWEERIRRRYKRG